MVNHIKIENTTLWLCKHTMKNQLFEQIYVMYYVYIAHRYMAFIMCTRLWWHLDNLYGGLLLFFLSFLLARCSETHPLAGTPGTGILGCNTGGGRLPTAAGVGWGGEDNNVSKGALTKCRQLSAGVEKLRTGPLSRLRTTSSVRPSVRPHSTASWWNIFAMCQSRSTETLALSIKLYQVIREFHTISVVWLKYLVLSVKLNRRRWVSCGEK